MTEGYIFTDKVPYQRGSNIEKKRHQRRSARIVLEELGAEEVRIIHVGGEALTHYSISEDPDRYLVTGTIDDNTGTVQQIKKVLKLRGGKSFSSERCSIDKR